MRLLLDTHSFLWFIMGDKRLSAAARSAIENPADQKYLSMGSAWEIAIKTSLGKLTLSGPFDVLIPREMGRNGFIWQPIEFSHLAEVERLPKHHGDPFDRLLIAQARIEGMDIVGTDAIFDAYGVGRIW